MIIGAPSNPRFDAAVDPRVSITDTTIVRLNPSCSEPGGRVVLRKVDTDEEDVSRYKSSDSLPTAVPARFKGMVRVGGNQVASLSRLRYSR